MSLDIMAPWLFYRRCLTMESDLHNETSWRGLANKLWWVGVPTKVPSLAPFCRCSSHGLKQAILSYAWWWVMGNKKWWMKRRMITCNTSLMNTWQIWKFDYVSRWGIINPKWPLSKFHLCPVYHFINLGNPLWSFTVPLYWNKLLFSQYILKRPRMIQLWCSWSDPPQRFYTPGKLT